MHLLDPKLDHVLIQSDDVGMALIHAACWAHAAYTAWRVRLARVTTESGTTHINTSPNWEIRQQSVYDAPRLGMAHAGAGWIHEGLEVEGV